MRSPVGFCFSQPSRSGKIVWQLAEADGIHGLRAAGAGSAIGHRLEALGHLLETFGRLARALLARLRRLLDGLRGLLRCFFSLLLLGALAACCRSQRQRHRHDCHSMHAHHPRPHSKWQRGHSTTCPTSDYRRQLCSSLSGEQARLRAGAYVHAVARADAAWRFGQTGIRRCWARVPCASYWEGVESRRSTRRRPTGDLTCGGVVSRWRLRRWRKRAGMRPDAPHCWRNSIQTWCPSFHHV